MITFIGFVTILMAVVNFLKMDRLFYTLVFFMPFSASSILVMDGSKFGMQPALFLGLLLVFRTLLKYIVSRKVINMYERNIFFIILLFMILCAISLFNPILLNLFNIKYEVFNVIQTSKDFGSVSQFLYLMSFLAIFASIILFLDSYEKIRKSIYYFLISSTFTVFWALFVHEGSYLIGFEYPAFIFNNHQGYSQGYTQVIYGFINRICSVAQEPSIYAYLLSISTIILLFSTFMKVYFFKKGLQITLLVLHIFTMLLTTSSTAYLGLTIIFMLYLLFELKKTKFPKLSKRLFNFLVLMFILIGTLIFVLNILVSMFLDFNLFDLLKLLTIDKFNDGSSGSERLNLLILGFQSFVDTYMLGAGYGVNRTVDLNTTILSNIGIIGFLSWLLIFIYPAYVLYKLYKKKLVRNKNLVIIIIYSNLISYTLMSFSVPDFVNLYFWLYLGMFIAVPNIIIRNNKKGFKSEKNLRRC